MKPTLHPSGNALDDLQNRVNNLEEQNGNLLNTRESLLLENYALRGAIENVIAVYKKLTKVKS